MKKALMVPFTPKDANLEILSLLAQEMDPNRRDTRFSAPFSVPRKKQGRSGPYF